MINNLNYYTHEYINKYYKKIINFYNIKKIDNIKKTGENIFYPHISKFNTYFFNTIALFDISMALFVFSVCIPDHINYWWEKRQNNKNSLYIAKMQAKKAEDLANYWTNKNKEMAQEMANDRKNEENELQKINKFLELDNQQNKIKEETENNNFIKNHNLKEQNHNVFKLYNEQLSLF
jgi:hypothetical protein